MFKLKSMLLVALLFIVPLPFFSGCSSNISAPSNIPTIIAPAEYEPPHPQEFSLSNGISVLFMPDHELPIVRGVIYFRGGGLLRGDLPRGVLSLMGDQLREGGAGSLSADQLDIRLEELSAGIDSSFGDEFGTVSFSCLSADIPEVLDITRDVIRAPRFDSNRFNLAKSQLLESIRRRIDSPDTVASIALNQLLFGDSILGDPVTSLDVKMFSSEQIQQAYARFVHPEGAIIAVSGDIEKNRLKILLEQRFGDWESTPRNLPSIPDISFRPNAGVYFVRLPFEQATIMIARQGPQRLSEDYVAIEGFNQLFGSDSSFSSELVKRVRTKSGFAYSVVGGIYPGMPIGKNFIGLQTKAQSAGPVLRETLAVLKEFRQGKIEPEALVDAVRAAENSFVFRYESSDRIVQRAALLRLLNFPESYDDTFIPKLRELSPIEISRVAKERWPLEDAIVVVVGNSDAETSIKEWLAHEDKALSKLPFYEGTFDEIFYLTH